MPRAKTADLERMALEIVQEFGIEKLDAMEVEEANLQRAVFHWRLKNRSGCHEETARRHIAKACRRLRHPDYQKPQHGGKRPGAGRKPVEREVSEYEKLTAGMTQEHQDWFAICPMFIGGDSIDMETFVEEHWKQPVTDENFRQVAQEFRKWFREEAPGEYHPPADDPFSAPPRWF